MSGAFLHGADNDDCDRRALTAHVIAAVAAIGVVALVSAGSVAFAMVHKGNIGRGKYIWSTKSTCQRCHGWAGDGHGHPRSPGDAPSLRTSTLTREQMHEVIACGVPGTAMPHHDRHAYSDGRCYGLTKKDLSSEDMPKLGQKPIRSNEIELVIDYIEARIKGRGAVTREECEDYFKVGAGRCQRYPEAVELTN